MSGEANRQTILDADTERFAKEYGDLTAVESDPEGAPDDVVESEAEVDGALAVDENAEEEVSDLEEEAPETEETEEVVDWEKRYKDTQQHIEETNAEMRSMREEQAKVMGEVTQARYDLADKLGEAEKAAEFWSQQALHDVQRLQSVNVQQLTQEQYQQWQQQMTVAQQRAQAYQQGFQQTSERAKAARDEALRREATVARAQLNSLIPDFDEVYPEIGKYAVENGVNPKVWQELTDPGLVRLLYKAMKYSQAPDIIEKVETKTKAKVQTARNLRERDEAGRFKKLEKNIQSARSPAERRAAYAARDEARLRKEYGD